MVEGNKTVIYIAELQSGDGWRSKMMSEEKHMNKLNLLMGISFFPGSLNLKLDRKLYTKTYITTPVGDLCPARLNGEKIFIKAKRGKYASAFADTKLRDMLQVTDGDKLILTIDSKYVDEIKQHEDDSTENENQNMN